MSELDEAIRQYTICNACRYCEGYCPVWPTLSSMVDVKENDVVYMANLCLDHRDCYYACPYVPEVHEFKINIPEINKQLRYSTYSKLNPFAGRKYVYAALLIPLAIMWLLYFPKKYGSLSFYNLVPKYTIIISGILVLVYMLAVLGYALVKYRNMIGSMYTPKLNKIFETLLDLLKHSWFSDMHYPSEKESNIRIAYHLLIFYGFLLDFVSTLLGMLYEDILHISSPFPIQNPTVITGLAGGIFLIIGTTIALYARIFSYRKQKFVKGTSIDLYLTLTLMIVAVTGILVLVLRLNGMISSMYLMLLVHYSSIYLLFVLAPLSSTFMHAIIRPYSLWIYNSIIGKKKLVLRLNKEQNL